MVLFSSTVATSNIVIEYTLFYYYRSARNTPTSAGTQRGLYRFLIFATGVLNRTDSEDLIP